MDHRIVLADDHALFLDGVSALLSPCADLCVVARVGCGLEVIEVARRERPALVVMDIEMPGLNGIEATRRIVGEGLCRVLCLSMHSREHLIKAALEAGASGYLLKGCSGQELEHAVRTVLVGQAYISPAIADVLIGALRGRKAMEVSSAFGTLTQREREVLQLLAEGLSTKEVAGRLRISSKTVATHREHMVAKLRVRGIAGLTKYAVREGLTSPEPSRID